MPDSISVDTADSYTASLASRQRSRSSTYSVHESATGTATATVLSRAPESEPAGQAPAPTVRRTHAPDTSADLTRNWLTATAPPPFSRKGVTAVVMPVKATSLDIDPKPRQRAQSTSRAQRAEGKGSGYTRHGRVESESQFRGGLRVPESEEGGEGKPRGRLAEERTLGWVTLSRGMSIGSIHRRGLRERKRNNAVLEDNSGVVHDVPIERGVGLGLSEDRNGEGDCVDGRKLNRKWPWNSFLKMVDKKLGKKATT